MRGSRYARGTHDESKEKAVSTQPSTIAATGSAGEVGSRERERFSRRASGASASTDVCGSSASDTMLLLPPMTRGLLLRPRHQRRDNAAAVDLMRQERHRECILVR